MALRRLGAITVMTAAKMASAAIITSERAAAVAQMMGKSSGHCTLSKAKIMVATAQMRMRLA